MRSVDMPYGAEVTEAMSVAYGGIDSYDFHALEVIQCMTERRKGGETGPPSSAPLPHSSCRALRLGLPCASPRHMRTAALSAPPPKHPAGVLWVHSLRGDEVWAAMRGCTGFDDGGWDLRLFEA